MNHPRHSRNDKGLNGDLGDTFKNLPHLAGQVDMNDEDFSSILDDSSLGDRVILPAAARHTKEFEKSQSRCRQQSDSSSLDSNFDCSNVKPERHYGSDSYIDMIRQTAIAQCLLFMLPIGVILVFGVWFVNFMLGVNNLTSLIASLVIIAIMYFCSVGYVVATVKIAENSDYVKYLNSIR